MRTRICLVDYRTMTIRIPQSAIACGVIMFEQPAGRVEKDRSRLIMLSTGATVLLVIGVIVLFSSYCSREAPIEMVRAGSPEFDSYSPFVSIAINDKRAGERLGVRYARLLCTVRNDGDQVLVGLQVRAVLLGFSNEVLVEKVSTHIPKPRETLNPHQSMDVDLNIEPIPDPSGIMDMAVEIHALKVKPLME